MFGAFRFFLSLVVMQAHLLHHGVNAFAWQAVFCFYTLSGFLMTATLHTTYGFDKNGLARFGMNRFLRLYPVYYATALLVLLHTVFIGGLSVPSHTAMPEQVWEFIPWLTILGHTGFTYDYMQHYWKYTLVFNAWSLNIEIVCYLLLALYFGKTPARLWGMFWLGVVMIIFTAFLPWDKTVAGAYNFQNHYGVLQAGFSPFALGGLCYFYREHLTKYLQKWRIRDIFCAFAVNAALSSFIPFHARVTALYVAVVLMAALIVKLQNYQFKNPQHAAWDRYLGTLAYPVFILHWAVAGIMVYHFPVMGDKNWLDFMAFTVVTLGLSVLAVKYLDTPINRLRHAIRSRHHVPD